MTYKLTYFDCRGLGEPIRLLLADNGIQFEDDQFTQEQWPSIKPNMVFGQAPVLYDVDEPIYQTGAILRHLARKHHLNGNNESETTFIDMFHEGLRDIHHKYVQTIYGDFEGERENLAKVYLPSQYAILEKLLKTYCNGEKYVAGEKISYVDYVLFEELDIGLILDGQILDNFPTLKAYHHRFAGRSTIIDYLNRRAVLNPKVNGNGKQ